MIDFINRFSELEALSQQASGLTVIFGRRRIGKTCLVQKWGENKNVFYSQAIEGAETIQISQILEDLQEILPAGLVARAWPELLSLFSLIQEKCTIVLDEFPYLVKTNQSLPSMIQRWVDHKQPKNVHLILLGSSQSMMTHLFLNSSSPLYERAQLILHIHPMSYRYFCQAKKLDPFLKETFELYSLVGGVPRYWQSVQPQITAVELAEKLYFQKSAYLENEPDRLLKDEDINGMQAKSIFEAIGRGASKPSEIAARIGLHQTALSKPMKLLIATSLIEKENPFDESHRHSKKTIYDLSDIAMSFWYKVYSPHRSRWHLYSLEKKQKLIHDHASQILEKSFRLLFVDAARYWEKDIEFDCVRSLNDKNEIIISEIKHRDLTEKEILSLEKQINKNFLRSKLAERFQLAKIEVLGTKEVLQYLLQ